MGAHGEMRANAFISRTQRDIRPRGLGIITRPSRCLTISEKYPELAGAYLIGYHPSKITFLRPGCADDRR